MNLQRAFVLGFCRVAGTLGALGGGLALFHQSLEGFALGVIAGGAVIELLPTLDARNEPSLFVAEGVGAATALAFVIAYERVSWWYFGGLVVVLAVIEVARARSAPRP